MRRSLVILVCTGLLGCGGGGGGGGTGVTPTTTTSITVTLQSPIRMGQTTPATAIAQMSNGQSQALTSGWLSDAPAVASVTTTGTVTGVANGRATIYLVSDGHQGQQVIRVTPDYHGGWEGDIRVTSCDASGVWVSSDLCKGEVGKVYGWAISFDQSGESLKAKVDYGNNFVFPTVDAAIRGDGTSSFEANHQITEDNVTVAVKATLDINSARVGELTGTLKEVWTLPNIQGELRYSYDMLRMSRTSVNALGATAQGPSRLDFIRRLVP